MIILLFFLYVGVFTDTPKEKVTWYDPCYQEMWTVNNPTGSTRQEEFLLEIDTNALVLDKSKLDSECRDLRFYTNQTDGKMKYVDFWFEDKCGVNNKTRVWIIMNIQSYDTDFLFMRYGSDYFEEKSSEEYTNYKKSNYRVNSTGGNFWSGEFWKISLSSCDDSELKKMGYSTQTEAEGRLILARGSDKLSEPKFYFHDDVESGRSQSYHRHESIKYMETTVAMNTNEFVNVTKFTTVSGQALGDHFHDYPSFYVLSNTSSKMLNEFVPFLPPYRNFFFCKSKYNTQFTNFTLLAFHNNGIQGYKNLVQEGSKDNVFIRLSNNDAGKTRYGGCSNHSHHDFSVKGYSGINMPKTVAVEVDEVDYILVNEKSNYEHELSCKFNPQICPPEYGFSYKRVKMYYTTNISANMYPLDVYFMGNKIPPLGYQEVNMGEFITLFNLEYTLLGLKMVPESEDVLKQSTGSEFQDYKGWYHGLYASHRLDCTFGPGLFGDSNFVKAKRGTDGNTVLVSARDHVHTWEKDRVATQPYDSYPTDYKKMDMWSSGFYGVAPRYYKLKTGFKFIVKKFGNESKIKEGNCARNYTEKEDPEPENPPNPPTAPGDPIPVWVWGASGGTGFLLLGGGASTIFCCGICLLCCCCLFWIVVVVVVVLILIVLVCCGCCGICGLSSVLGTVLANMRAATTEEGAKRQMKIAMEKSNYRQEKKKVDVEIKIATEQGIAITKQIVDLTEIQKAKTSNPSSFKLQANIVKIEFADVDKKQKLGKGYLGFKIHRAEWQGNEVLFRVFSAKTFKTKRFNIFGNFEQELAEYSSLEHPNVLRYLAYSELPNVGVVTEFCDKATLPILFKKEDIDFESKIKIISQIVDGMCYLHSRGVIHRDLQAGNIFLDKDYCPKVDFGFNRTFNKSYDCSQYAAPELIFQQSIPEDDDELPNNEKFDVKCDVFAFGILMYEIAQAVQGGEHNFNAYDVEDREEEIGKKVAEDPSFRPDFEKFDAQDCPNWYINLAQRCWAHRASERPSFERIRDILKNIASTGDEENESPSSSGSDSDVDSD